MLEVRWHGRGGQGAWTAANLLAMAAMLDGKHVQSFPAFGPERSGAPLLAFTRISDEPIEIHSMIYEPDIVVVLDPTLLKTQDVTEGLKKGGTIVVNYSGNGDELLKELGVGEDEYRVFYVPATKLAMDVLGRPIMNTAMVGALLKAEPVASMGSVEEAVKTRFTGKLAELNNRLIKKAMEETKEVE